MPVHSLVPESLRDVRDVGQFMAELPNFDGDMEGLLQEADAADECIRFVGEAPIKFLSFFGSFLSCQDCRWRVGTPFPSSFVLTREFRAFVWAVSAQKQSRFRARRSVCVGQPREMSSRGSRTTHFAAAGVVDVKAGKGSVELKRYPKSHPFAQLSGSDNIIAFTTQRYINQPLIVR